MGNDDRPGGTDEGDAGGEGDADGDGQGDHPTEFRNESTASGLAAAREWREALSPAERERVEATVSALLDLLGKAHTMAVLREFAFADGPLRYSDLEDALGVSPNTLSARLRDLVEAGLLSRTAYDEMPPRVEYRPTERARALFPAFGHFHRWATEYGLGPADDEAIDDASSVSPDGSDAA